MQPVYCMYTGHNIKKNRWRGSHASKRQKAYIVTNVCTNTTNYNQPEVRLEQIRFNYNKQASASKNKQLKTLKQTRWNYRMYVRKSG